MRLTHLFVIAAIAIACEDTHQMTQEEELQEIVRMREEIASLSLSETCSNTEDWTYVGIGHKACGGPAEYVAYSIFINVDNFEALIEEYTIAQMEFNKRWGIASDCALTQSPSGVICEDGEAVLVYEN